MAGSKLPGELTWPKLLGTSIAAVVAAWLAGYLGLGNTLTGVAIGSIIATFGAAFFTSSIDKSHQAILVRTERGSVVEVPAETDVPDEAGSQTTVLPTQTTQPGLPPLSPAGPATPSRWSQIHWRSAAIAAVVTMAVTLAVISLYEGAVGRTWGSNEPGTTIGNTVRGGPQPLTSPTPSPTPTEAPTESPTPTEAPTESPTPTEQPSGSPSPSESPTPSDCPTATASADPQSPSPESTDCPDADDPSVAPLLR